MAEPSVLEKWVDGLLRERFHTRGALARAAGLSESAFSRQIRAGTLGITPLLRLALATGEAASTVLARAGKQELSALIEQCYGAPRPVSAAVREFSELIQPPLPDEVVQRELASLRGLRELLLSRGFAYTPASAASVASPSTRGKRAVRGK